MEDFSPTSTVGLPGGGALTDVFKPLQKLQQVMPRVKMDIIEQPDKYVVKAEIPGVGPTAVASLTPGTGNSSTPTALTALTPVSVALVSAGEEGVRVHC